MTITPLLKGNPESQGYCMTQQQLHELRFAVRFSTALCLPIVATGLVLASPVLLLALAGIAAVAGFTPRHPFDVVWNRSVRRVLRGAPELPPNPRRRRHAFKLGGALLVVVAALFAAGASTAAVALGVALLVACASATVLNFCVPSAALALLERRRRPETRLA